jgi:hypothetical protein
MPTQEIIKTLTEYNYAIYPRIWESIMTLSDE